MFNLFSRLLPLLSADVVNTPPPQSISSLVITAAFMIGLMYLLIWRPEKKRRKAMESMRTGLKVGDRVIAMGIVGTVYAIKEDTMILRMYDGAKIEMLKAAINEVNASGQGQTQQSKESSSKVKEEEIPASATAEKV
jgi:preprotein translocase subunit YajC